MKTPPKPKPFTTGPHPSIERQQPPLDSDRQRAIRAELGLNVRFSPDLSPLGIARKRFRDAIAPTVNEPHFPQDFPGAHTGDDTSRGA